MYCRFINLRRLPGKTTNFNADIHLKDNATTKGAVYFMRTVKLAACFTFISTIQELRVLHNLRLNVRHVA